MILIADSNWLRCRAVLLPIARPFVITPFSQYAVAWLKQWRSRKNNAVFKLLIPKFTEATEKSVFFKEKRLLNEKSSKFCYERIHANTDSRIPAKFRGNR